MDAYTHYKFSPVLFNPSTKLHRIRGYRFKKSDWNEYQKLEQHNPLVDVNRYPIKINYDKENLVRLAGIKTGIYNPMLPTLRKSDRDDVLGKLTDEHARHTTFIKRKELTSSTPYLTPVQRADLWDLDDDDYYKDETEELNKKNRVISSLPLSRRTALIRLANPEFQITYQRPFSASTHDGMNQFDDIRKSYNIYRNHVLLSKKLLN